MVIIILQATLVEIRHRPVCAHVPDPPADHLLRGAGPVDRRRSAADQDVEFALSSQVGTAQHVSGNKSNIALSCSSASSRAKATEMVVDAAA